MPRVATYDLTVYYYLGRLPLAVYHRLKQRADEHAEAAEESLQPGVGGLQCRGLRGVRGVRRKCFDG